MQLLVDVHPSHGLHFPPARGRSIGSFSLSHPFSWTLFPAQGDVSTSCIQTHHCCFWISLLICREGQVSG